MDVREETSGATGMQQWNTDQGSRRQLRLRKETTTGNGITGRIRRQEPHLGSKTTFGRIFRKTVELEVAKQIVGNPIRLQKMSDWTLWRDVPL
jgi:hypothetical protein